MKINRKSEDYKKLQYLLHLTKDSEKELIYRLVIQLQKSILYPSTTDYEFLEVDAEKILN
jgi:hypothetical protein|tara:strand:+ start:473 stop:652 length:180 start_codon:yes stop_codon:yes gene_type:complete